MIGPEEADKIGDGVVAAVLAYKDMMMRELGELPERYRRGEVNRDLREEEETFYMIEISWAQGVLDHFPLTPNDPRSSKDGN